MCLSTLELQADSVEETRALHSPPAAVVQPTPAADAAGNVTPHTRSCTTSSKVIFHTYGVTRTPSFLMNEDQGGARSIRFAIRIPDFTTWFHACALKKQLPQHAQFKGQLCGGRERGERHRYTRLHLLERQLARKWLPMQARLVS